METYIAFLPVISVFFISWLDQMVNDRSIKSILHMPVIHKLEDQTWQKLTNYQSKNHHCPAQEFWQALANSSALSATCIRTLPHQKLSALHTLLHGIWHSHLAVQDQESLNKTLPGFQKFIEKKMSQQERQLFKKTLWKQIHNNEQDLYDIIKKLSPQRKISTIHDSIRAINTFKESPETQKIISLKNDIQALLTLNQLVENSPHSLLKSKL